MKNPNHSYHLFFQMLSPASYNGNKSCFEGSFILGLNATPIPFIERLYFIFNADKTKLTRCTPGNNEHTLHKVSQRKVVFVA